MVEIGGAECADNSPGTVQQAEQTSSSAVRVVIVKSASAHLELFPVYSLADPSRRTGRHGVVLAVCQIGHAVTGDVQHTGRPALETARASYYRLTFEQPATEREGAQGRHSFAPKPALFL